MGARQPRFEAAFVDGKRCELTALREALRQATARSEYEETGIKDESLQQSHEREEDAQNLAALEKEDILVGHYAGRLARIERALEKIGEGTYGFSDISGERIPEARLDAVPEAINTIQEQEESEALQRKPPPTGARELEYE